ncbi:MAG: glutathione S-transferase N-terminal domain-containing protein, partial [Desulfopila sp.]|nr:glutathione S-transferase N-terminal domain-containing protein [Desulfopila sp.]
MIELYIREDCPFCRKVLQAADEMGLLQGKDYTVVDGSPDTPGRETVLRVGGKAMVPFLIDG